VVAGAAAAGGRQFLYMPDPNHLAETAAEGLGPEVSLEAVASPGTASALDTVRAAEQMRAEGCAVVVVLGGDGTNRAVAKGWLDAPVIPMSTGTNNVFPSMIEGTTAGMAAGVIASGAVSTKRAVDQAKVVHLGFEDGTCDLALIDVAVVDSLFTGSRALWDASVIRELILTRADPAAVGMSAIGGMLKPVPAEKDRGLRVRLGGEGASLRVPIAPGLFSCVTAKSVERVALGERLEIEGPGMLAFDGERERALQAGETVNVVIRRDGLRVVDVRRTLTLAAKRGAFANGRHRDNGRV
jgi:predicted polyphosphate/ATP-dependent NAD kinase